MSRDILILGSLITNYNNKTHISMCACVVGIGNDYPKRLLLFDLFLNPWITGCKNCVALLYPEY